MDARTLKQKYLAFFESKGHVIIPSASLIPENDPTVLFTTAGMHPLIPFLTGTPHPLGKRVTNVQKCLRTQDIDEVGDTTHTTCFEMLGNWSFGDYFKKEAVEWSWEFLTSKEWLGLDSNRLAVSCFKGDADAPKDEESAGVWRELGVAEERIAFLGKKDNWWGPAGETGPCGPDTEMFYWKLNNTPVPKTFDPDDENWVEIWNDVFMQYDKQADGTFKELAQQSVDTGLGVERVAMTLQGKETIFDTEVFQPLFKIITNISKKNPEDAIESFRIVADHIRAATFILGDERGVTPSNVDQGYILRRFIRRAIRHARLLGIDVEQQDLLKQLANNVISIYEPDHPILKEKQEFIIKELENEQKKFLTTLEKGLRVLKKEIEQLKTNKEKDDEYKPQFSGKTAFLLFQSYGFPLELTQEILDEEEISVNVKEFDNEFAQHQALSRKGAEKKFKGGLADNGEATTKLHTATHLLNEALRKIVDPNIVQRGSNITAERLRFDFNFDRKLTPEEKQAVEDEVNRVIKAGLEVTKTEMAPTDALAQGAQGEFGARYPDLVSVYHVGDYSKEICMGPHVKNTKELGNFRIKKEQSSAAGIRRIKAIVE